MTAGGRRPRVLIAWELGRNFGHATLVAALARALGERAEVWLAMRDPALLRRFAPDVLAPLLPAPVASLRPRKPETVPGRSYPDDLRHCGWDDAGTLGALMASWRTILGLVRPDMLVAQSAPTALLAARGTGVALANYGNGYDLPPRAAPVPPFLWWRTGTAAEAEAGEAVATGAAERALAEAGAPALGAFHGLFDGVLPLLAALPGLDHYGDRRRWEAAPPPPLGAVAELDAGVALDWLPGERRRVLAYLRHGLPGFDAALDALAGAPGDWDAVLASPGIPAGARGGLGAAGVRVADGPVRLRPLLGAGCDLGLCHASPGTAHAFLMAGVPQVGLPTQVEQLMMARAVTQAGIGLALPPGGDGAALRGLMDEALAPGPLRERVAALRGRRWPDAAQAAAARILARLGA